MNVQVSFVIGMEAIVQKILVILSIVNFYVFKNHYAIGMFNINNVKNGMWNLISVNL